MKTKIKLFLLTAIVFSFAVSVIASSGDKKSVQPTSISAKDLVAAYVKNSKSADAKYNDKEILINGTIDKVGKSMLNGEPYVVFKFDKNEVQIYFKKEEIDKASKLKAGEKLKVKGNCAGKFSDYISILDCTIQK